ncbi:hypothetical protein ACEZ3G_10495 [Maribacter algicola]|uniref:Uncharacterized protein n=1 Tax=Meishania litoralis TaxID=3434685 RepID=A0ACC7LJJ4_9FLAO
MKKIVPAFALIAMVLLTLSATTAIESDSNLTENFVTGNPGIASINHISFGPEGILFLGDSKSAAIYALNTKDVKTAAPATEININGFDKKVASALGTTVENIKITDMAVNPISRNVYFSVQAADGTPVLLKLKGEGFENISLKDVSYSKIELTDPIPADAKDKWERPLRTWAISDLKFHDGQVLVSGLSNKEFGSTFRKIPFPFKDGQEYASLEIWHAAHGEYETHAPIKTFDVIKLDGVDHLMASYTCTPLVLFPLDELKEGKHTKGRTVAELGAGNSPLDMISYEREGSTYFLMSNSNRPVMRIKYDDIADFKESLTDPVPVFAETEGVPYDNLPFPYVLQMDNLDATHVIYLQRQSDGDLRLRVRTTEWM